MRRFCANVLIAAGLAAAGSSSAGSEGAVYCRVEAAGQASYARLDEGRLRLLTAAPWAGGMETGASIAAEGAAFLPPAEPRTIIGIAEAYTPPGDRAPKTTRWFAKSASAIATTGDEVPVPSSLDALKVEVELAMVIGKRIKEVEPEAARAAIFGYATGTEIFGFVDSYHRVTGESSGRAEGMLAAGLKLGDKFAPFGPCIHAGAGWQGRERKLAIVGADGKTRINYSHNTSDLLYPPERIVSDLSKVMTLEPGDLVFSGTSKSFIIHPGESVTTEIEGLGTLTNKIVQ